MSDRGDDRRHQNRQKNKGKTGDDPSLHDHPSLLMRFSIVYIIAPAEVKPIPGSCFVRGN